MTTPPRSCNIDTTWQFFHLMANIDLHCQAKKTYSCFPTHYLGTEARMDNDDVISRLCWPNDSQLRITITIWAKSTFWWLLFSWCNIFPMQWNMNEQLLSQTKHVGCDSWIETFINLVKLLSLSSFQLCVGYGDLSCLGCDDLTCNSFHKKQCILISHVVLLVTAGLVISLTSKFSWISTNFH